MQSKCYSHMLNIQRSITAPRLLPSPHFLSGKKKKRKINDNLFGLELKMLKAYLSLNFSYHRISISCVAGKTNHFLHIWASWDSHQLLHRATLSKGILSLCLTALCVIPALPLNPGCASFFLLQSISRGRIYFIVYNLFSILGLS